MILVNYQLYLWLCSEWPVLGHTGEERKSNNKRQLIRSIYYVDSDQGQTIDRLGFNGKEYMIADLTDRVKAGINVLLKIQQDLNNLSQEVRIQQAAQTEITKQITANIEEDKAKEIEPAETKVVDEQMKLLMDIIESEDK